MDYPIPHYTFEELIYKKEESIFSLWSPYAQGVKLNLYNSYDSISPTSSYQMEYTENGVWRIVIQEDLKDMFYTFNVLIENDWLEETPGITAKAISVNGERGAIIDMSETNPSDWEKDNKPPLNNIADSIIYEMHYRDFSMSPSSGITNKGKFLALTESGTTNPERLSTGIDHLKELGITHVHLLPSFDFATIDETKLYENKYNWGYDPQNYNVPEGSYSTDPYNPVTRIKEFKEMILHLHKAGIRVIMDVVYNHVYSLSDNPFERTCPGYFFRKKPNGTFSNASGCGNEMASERPMMRKYILESLLYWINEYHIDGFRFDLMGIYDIETMNAIREEINKIDPSIILYGEGWFAHTPQLPSYSRATKENIINMQGIGAFSDELRDALRGPCYNERRGGFLSGMTGHEESIKFGITGAIWHPDINYYNVLHSSNPWAFSPTQMIAYASCHDDLCLVDRLLVTVKKISEKELIKLSKLAQTIILTTQGIPFLFAGEEVLRTKQGYHNTYKSSDSINQINWNNKSKYYDLFCYYKELIKLRKAHPAFRMGDADLVRKNLEFLNIKQDNFVAFSLNNHANGDTAEKIIVAFNANKFPVSFLVENGIYKVVCRDGKIDTNGLEYINGRKMTVSSQSALIITK